MDRIISFLLIVSLFMALVIGILWQKVHNLEAGTTNNSGLQVEAEQVGR